MFRFPTHWMPWDNWVEGLADGICVFILALILPPLFYGHRPAPGILYFFSRGLGVLALHALFLATLVGLRHLQTRFAFAARLSILLSHGRYFFAVIFCVAGYGLLFA